MQKYSQSPQQLDFAELFAECAYQICHTACSVRQLPVVPAPRRGRQQKATAVPSSVAGCGRSVASSIEVAVPGAPEQFGRLRPDRNDTIPERGRSANLPCTLIQAAPIYQCRSSSRQAPNIGYRRVGGQRPRPPMGTRGGAENCRRQLQARRLTTHTRCGNVILIRERNVLTRRDLSGASDGE